jgi:hypothetical protein
MEALQTLLGGIGDYLVQLIASLSMLAGLGLVKGISSQGITLHMSVEGSPTNFQKVGNVTNFRGPGGQAAVLDASNLESTFKEKLIGLPDEGQFSFDINLDPDDTVHTAIRTARRNRTLCEFKVTLTDSTPKQVIFFGYVMGFSIAGGVDQIVKASITIEIDGEVSYL